MMLRNGLVALLLALVGCVQTTLNEPCTLVRRGSDGGSIAIKEQEIAGNANKDFISFGAGCDEFVCVRDSSFLPTSAAPTDDAQGYCSMPCAPGSTTGCPSARGALDKDPATRLSCRALLLDEATLAACRADPSCLGRLGPTTSPYFCARGRSGGSI